MESDSDEQAADHGAGCGKCAIIEQYQGSSQMTDSWPYHQIQDLVEPDSPVSYGVVKPGEEGDIPFVRGGDLSDGKVLQSQLRTITREVSDQYKRTLLRGGELLICLVGQPGQVGVAPLSLAGANIARQVGIVRLLEIVTPEFASYFLRSPQGQKQLGSYTGGSVQQVINLVDLRKVFVPIPPLPEQQRIVALLDEAFAGLATAKANAERNLQNAREVFESHLESVFANCPDRWISRRLADCLELITYGFTNPMPTAPSGPFMITARNVVGGRIDYASTRHTSQEAFETLLTDKSRPRLGDVLLTKDGTLGRVAVVDKQGTCINQSVALLRTNARMTPHFMRFLLSSRGYQKQMIDDAGGTTIKHIYITRVDKMPVVFPDSAEEQEKIVCELNTLAAECKRLERFYERKLAALEELKQSLLQQAFNGEL